MREPFLAILIGVVVHTAALGEDWPRWRGPRADGSWNGPELPAGWSIQDVQTRWRKPIGAGYSGVTVAAGRVFTMDRPKPTDKEKTPDGSERVLCFDADSGRQLWSHEYPAHYGKLDYGSGPRVAPTIDGDQLYALGAVGLLSCLDVNTGVMRWSHDMVAEFKARIPEWGFASHPVVIGQTVVVHTGGEPNGSIIAFDRKTGKEVWRNLPDMTGYGTPILIDSPSGPQLVLWTSENVHGLDTRTGERLWTVPYKITYGVSIPTPIYADGIVFVTGYWEGAKAIELGAERSSAKLLWAENRHFRGIMAPPLYRDGHVYTLDKQFGTSCLELRTGKKVWDDGNRMTPKDRNPQATFVWIGDDDRVLCLNSEGELVFARFSPTGYSEEGRTKIIGPTWANPAFAGNCVYARNDTELVCVTLASNASQ